MGFTGYVRSTGWTEAVAEVQYEIYMDLAPVLLGSGVRPFDQLGIEPVELECM